MIVVDASVVLEILLRLPRASAAEDRLTEARSLHAPGLLDLEVTQVIRRHCLAGLIAAERGERAVARLADLLIRRYPHSPLLRRIWELKSNLTAYDGAYIALAESLEAPLLTLDRRLVGGKWHRVAIELL